MRPSLVVVATSDGSEVGCAVSARDAAIGARGRSAARDDSTAMDLSRGSRSVTWRRRRSVVVVVMRRGDVSWRASLRADGGADSNPRRCDATLVANELLDETAEQEGGAAIAKPQIKTSQKVETVQKEKVKQRQEAKNNNKDKKNTWQH